MRIQITADEAGEIYAEPSPGLTDLAAFPASMFEVNDEWWAGYEVLRKSYEMAQDQLRRMLDLRWDELPSKRHQLRHVKPPSGGRVVSRLRYTQPLIRTNYGVSAAGDQRRDELEDALL